MNKERKREYRKKYHQANKERDNKQALEYYYKNRKRLLQNQKEYRENNKDKIKQDREENRENIRSYFKKYYRTPKGKFKEAQKSAKYRKLEWDITFEYYTYLSSQKCYYSMNHKMPETGIGLDRIDNSKGYTIDNVVPCCTDCNMARGNRYTVEEWKIMIEALENFKKGKNE